MSNYHTKFILDNTFINDPVQTESFVVYQVADLYCEYDTTIDAHRQDYFEISAVETGKGYMSTDDVTLPLTKGDVYLSFVGDMHRITSHDVDTLRYYCVAFAAKDDKVEKMMQRIAAANRDPGQRRLRFAPAAGHIDRMINEIYNGAEFYLEMLEAELMSLLVSLYRLSLGMECQEHFKINNSKNITYSVMNYIDQNLTSIANVEDLARSIPYSYAYAAGIFKKVTGKTVNGYLLEKRMEYAKLLLQDRKKSVSAVSEALGYSSPNNFNRAFKSRFGISPREFKQSCGEDEPR